MRSTKLGENLPCPVCGTNINGASALSEDVVPKEHDVTVCVYCRSFLVIVLKEQAFAYRELTTEEIAALPDELRNEMLKLRILLRSFKPDGTGVA